MAPCARNQNKLVNSQLFEKGSPVCVLRNIGILTKKEERKMVARVTKEAITTSGGISVPLRPMMGVKISNTTQMRNMKWT